MEEDKMELEINLLHMIRYFKSKGMYIILITILCSIVAFTYTKLNNKKSYVREIQLYISAPSTSEDNPNELTQDYAKLIKTDLITKQVAKKTGIKNNQVKNAVTAKVMDGTRFISVMVETDNSNLNKKLAKSILDVTMNRIEKNLKKSKPIVVQGIGEEKTTYKMNTKKNTLVGALFGLISTISVLFVLYIMQISKKYKSN